MSVGSIAYSNKWMSAPALHRTAFVLVVSLAYLLLFNRPISLEMDGGVLAGLVLGLFAGGLAADRRQMVRAQKLRL